MNKIDHRKKYILMVDTETANTLPLPNGGNDMNDVLVYDIGFAVVDRKGNIYEEHSFVVQEIFFGERELMASAYYAKKLPQYFTDISTKRRVVARLNTIRRIIYGLVKEYRIEAVCAHNARFDIRALNNTIRYVTKSKQRFFFPYGVEVWDTMKMARSVVVPMKSYQRFCAENNYITKNGRFRVTAEILYRFIIGDNEYIENHTGLEDVHDETVILAYCFSKHKKMEKILYTRG